MNNFGEPGYAIECTRCNKQTHIRLPYSLNTAKCEHCGEDVTITPEKQAELALAYAAMDSVNALIGKLP